MELYHYFMYSYILSLLVNFHICNARLGKKIFHPISESSAFFVTDNNMSVQMNILCSSQKMNVTSCHITAYCRRVSCMMHFKCIELLQNTCGIQVGADVRVACTLWDQSWCKCKGSVYLWDESWCKCKGSVHLVGFKFVQMER